MQRSNSYIIIFTLVITIFVGGTLAMTSIILKPKQKKSVELDTKTQILKAVMSLNNEDDILSIYNQRIVGLVVDSKGNEVSKNDKGEPIIAEEVNVAKQYKVAPKDRMLPIFKYINKKNTQHVDAYILPVYGNGLWDRIWGFVALDASFKVIKGISFGHKAETPGLGARISDDPEISRRYKGKKIYAENGDLTSVLMVKGENGLPLDEHHIDGMSGATLTGNGVNEMLQKYFGYYQAYFEKTMPTHSLDIEQVVEKEESM